MSAGRQRRPAQTNSPAEDAEVEAGPVIRDGLQIVENLQPAKPARTVLSDSALQPGKKTARVLSGGDVLMVGPNAATMVVHPVKDKAVADRLLSEGWHFVNA